ncbi:MAG TPA: hypothetical protein DCG75_17500 [Bacteroidales bacterium]|nr:hypothetical protein [Bacteroidales bacterium]
MRNLLKKLIFFSLPVIVFLLIYLVTDPFKILYDYNDYYSKNDFVSLNRSVINTKTYIKNRGNIHYNSFIFGSSRTIAVKCKDWVEYLPDNAVPFHYDGNAENLSGINKKIKFIDTQSDTIKYALIFIDQMLLENSINKGHLYIEYPGVSNESWVHYHTLFIKAFSNPKFFLGYFYFKYTGNYKKFMGSKILKLKYPNIWDPITSDLFIGLETEIKNDSLNYYSKLKKLSELKYKVKPEVFLPNDTEIKLLNEIKEVFDKHQTKYKIVSNPFISQFPLCNKQKELLQNIFGKENVYDFSGKSQFSLHIDNFYDASHFRRKVAKEILKEIYSN